MNDSLITADRFDPQLRVTLAALLDTMIPADEEYKTPSAGTDDIVNDVIRSLHEDASTTLEEFLTRLNDQATTRFEDLDLDARWQAFAESQHLDAQALRALSAVLLQCYYRNDDVLKSLGMEARAPFPIGNEVEQGDWSLLDQVRSRGSFYREV